MLAETSRLWQQYYWLDVRSAKGFAAYSVLANPGAPRRSAIVIRILWAILK